MNIEVLTNEWPGYKLLDSGNRRKLEQFGSLRLIRSEPKAWWRPALDDTEWRKATAVHEDDAREGRWRFLDKSRREEVLTFAEKFRFQIKFPDNSKQVGLFPEQSPHWRWLYSQKHVTAAERPRVLNLFGYTGAASLVAAGAGWHVTHVDASKPAVAWGRHNQELSGMAEAPVRWIIEDAVKFLQREIRRGAQYDAIMLDPPAFGRGPNGELWKIERDLPPLLDACRRVLSPKARFVLLTVYTIDASSILCRNLLAQMTAGLGGNIAAGELAHREEASGRLLPLSLWGRWESGSGK